MRVIHRCLVHGLLAAAFLAGVQSAAAQEVPAGASVQGLIRGSAAAAARPLAVITREDIELSGAKDLRHLLSSYRAFNVFGLFRPFVQGTSSAAVLVNGLLISDASFDFETLPLSAVERIEILSDNAAALHGGHAYGGAINIVLRRDIEGFEVRTGAARPREPGGDFEHGGLLWGGAFGRGRAVIGVDLFRREEIRDADRDYTRGSWQEGGSFADALNISTGGNTLFFTPPGTTTTLARPLGDCQGSGYVSGLTNPRGHSGTGCGFDYTDVKWLDEWEGLERESLFLNATQPLGNAEGYLDARASWMETRLIYAPSVGDFEFTPSQALRTKLLADPDISALPNTLLVAHRFVAHGNRDWRTDVEEYDLVFGVRGQLGEVDYDASLHHFLYDLTRKADTFVSASAIQQAIADGNYDVENPLSTAPAHLQAVRDTSLSYKHSQVIKHTAVRSTFGMSGFEMAGGSTRWGLGVEGAYTDWESVHDYRDAAGTSYSAGDVLGGGQSSFGGIRRRMSTFAEVSLPFLKDWNLNLAGRYDEHDDVGETMSRSAAARYRLNDNLSVRASWGKGASPPGMSIVNLKELVGSTPNVCDVRTHLAGGATNLTGCALAQQNIVASANPDLESEDVETVGVGAVARLEPFSLSLDWFRIEVDNVPATLPGQTILFLEAQGRLPAGFRVVREGNAIRRIETSYANLGESEAEGFDLRAHVKGKASWADWAFDLRWVHLTESESRLLGEKVLGDFPRNRIHGALRLDRGRLTANWSTYMASEYANALGTATYDEWVGHDLTLRLRKAFGVRGLELTGGVLNLADHGPSHVPGTEGSALTLPSVLGRTLFLNARLTFGS